MFWPSEWWLFFFGGGGVKGRGVKGRGEIRAKMENQRNKATKALAG